MAPISGSAPSLIKLVKEFPGGLDMASAERMAKNIRSGDIETQLREVDRLEKEGIVRAADAQVPNVGESRTVAAAGDTQTPTESLESLDAPTRQAVERGAASDPAAPAPAPSFQAINDALGKGLYKPAAGIKLDAPVTGTRMRDGAVNPEVPPGADECVSLSNSPSALAGREIEQLKAQGYRLQSGQTWEGLHATRTDELSKNFIAAGGMWQMNPDKLASEAAAQLGRQGFSMSAAQTAALATDLNNHLIMNGGLLRSGGELANYVAAANPSTRMMGFGASALGATLIGGVASMAGTGLGALAGMVTGGPIGALAGGALGGGLGGLVGSMLANRSMMNPALGAFPSMAHNPVFMGTGGALATMGMGGFGSAMMGGGRGIGTGIGGALVGLTGGPMAGAQFAGNAMAQFQYGSMAVESKIRNLMRQSSILRDDQQMQALLNNPNITIEKLIAMWALKTTSRHSEELKDKMQKAELARQEEKAEKAKEENKSAIGGAVSSITSTLGPLAGMALGGPIGGMIGGLVGNVAGSGLTSALTGGSGSMTGGGQQAKSATALELEVQMAMSEWKQGVELASNIMKALHDMQMTIINNTR